MRPTLASGAREGRGRSGNGMREQNREKLGGVNAFPKVGKGWLGIHTMKYYKMEEGIMKLCDEGSAIVIHYKEFKSINIKKSRFGYFKKKTRCISKS